MKLSRKEQLQKNQNTRREAREKMLSHFAMSKKKKLGKAKQLPKSKGKPSEKKVQIESSTKARDAIQFECSATFADERDEPLEYHAVEPTYNLLAKDLTNIIHQGFVATTLLWPAFPSCVSAVHTVATCAAYERGDKMGFRAVYYPAKSNTFRELNHIRIDAQWLYDIAQQWQWQAQKGADDELISECKNKDFLYLTLYHYLEDSGDPAGYPSIGETFPTFPVGRQIWGDFSRKIFKGVFENVPKRGKSLEDLGNPLSAPDALFGIHPDLGIDDIVKRLTTEELLAETGRAPDVAIISLDSKSRVSLGKSWANKAARLVKLFRENLPYSPIGVQVLIDDPIAYLIFKKKLGEQLGDRKGTVRAGNTAFFKPVMNLNNSIVPKQDVTGRMISESQLEAHVVDAEAAAVAAEFSQAARVVQRESEELASSLRECGSYLLWTARLPSGQEALQEMLHDESASDQELQWKTERYSWIGVVRRLEVIRSELGESSSGPNIEKIVQKANDILNSYSTGTPSGIKLNELVQGIMEVTSESRAKKKKRSRPTVTIAVQSALQARLVYHTLEKDWPLFDEQGNEIIQVVRTAELFSRGSPTIARRLIVIGAQTRTVAELCSAYNLPKRIDLVLSAGDAERIVQRLDFILEESEFEQLHDPVSGLVVQLKEFLESVATQFSILANLVYWKPQTNALASVSHSSAITTTPDFQILLDDGGALGVYKSRPLLIYDETRRPPFAQKTGTDIEVGDHLLVISDEMRDDIEVYMDLAGRFKNENVVRMYHQVVFDRLATLYPDQNQTQISNSIKHEIQNAFPESTDITNHQIRYWISVDRELGQPFEVLLSHAPRSKENFERFMHVLNIDEQLVELYWTLGINSLRSDRRYEGRQANLIYQRFLMDPGSVAALLSIPAPEESRLLVQARSNIFEIIDKKVWV